MHEGDEDSDRRPLADRRPQEQVEENPTGAADIADEDAPSPTDPPNQWKDKNKLEGDEDIDEPPTRA
ncbi:hypothetical protein HDA32_002125 [Spinactinospora alkalitolerans]|uniref:Uncharacterized protein n=1 Tax=Spinactinospora alkalitolerans TaxID=687207 RepID=A0A852TU74_9ACTN|nr:hypothetical protein [Spinactinospora alkalitolerans]NYE47005.1 hypothetical protein [Spinactinospora alkalitolerans]